MSATAEAAALAVWQARLAGVCDEMGGALRRGAYSANIKERADFSCALFGPGGELVAQAEHIPVHLGSMAASVRAALDAFPGLGPGDQVALNDPFRGGTHLNDVTFVAAVTDDAGGLVGYVANRAHHADIGGGVPGSLSATAVDSVAEGLCIPPVRVVRDGVWDDDVRRLLLANTRTPGERAGDLDAQWGANRLGARRLAEVARTHGSVAVAAATSALCDYGERRLRSALAGALGARCGFADVLESAGGGAVPVRVAVAVDEAGVTADFGGTGAATPGVPSTVEAVTRACLEFAVRSAVDPTLPRNGGVSRLLHVVAPAGSVAAAGFPTPVGAGNVEASQRIADVLLGALAGIFPGRGGGAARVPAATARGGGRAPGGARGGRPAPGGGGRGGRPARPGHSPRAGMSGVHTGMTNTADEGHRSAVPMPGQSGIHTCMTNTMNTPIEALERAFPLRVLRYRLRQGSGGAGWAPGGEGIERDLQVLADATVSLITERRVSQPWGLAGGEPGAVGENWLLPGGDESRGERLPHKCTIQLKAGDVLRMLTPGGGGWGSPPSG